MKRVILGVLAACSSPPHAIVDALADAPRDARSVDGAVDASPCLAAAPSVPAYCATGGLAAIDLGGTWTLTGTTTTATADTAPVTAAYTGPLTMTARTSSGWCVFGLTRASTTPPVDDDTYVDTTHVWFAHVGVNSYVQRHVCAASDGSLAFHEQDDSYTSDVTTAVNYDGVLTR